MPAPSRLPSDAGVLPGPAEAAARGEGERGPLLERQADVAVLHALLDASWRGEGRLAVIQGSAGIGKTRLLAETRAIAAGIGFRVLSARAGQLEREFAFGVVRQLFEPLLMTASTEQRRDLFAGAAGLCARLFEHTGAGDASEETDAPFAILHGLYWLAANASLACGTLLAVDDLHWADAPSVRWLAYLARRLEGVPLMVAVSTRPSETGSDAPLILELLSDPAAVVIKPGALASESVVVLARAAFATEPAPEFCSACHAAAGGNPLYVRALLATLAAEGIQPTVDSCAHVYEVGPEPVARAVSLRLSRLGPEATALARAIAVLDHGADLARAAALAGLESEPSERAAAALARSEILRLEPRFELTHPIVRAAVYQSTGALDRVEAHRRAAGLLASAQVEPEQTAAHVLAVPPAGDSFGCTILREAARRAVARGAADAAVTYLRRALAEPPAVDERGEVLRQLGLAEQRGNVLAAGDHLLEALELTDEPVRYGEVALHCGRALFYASRNREAIGVLMGALGRLGSQRPDLREQLQAELIGTAWWERELYPEAEKLLAEIGEPDLDGVATPVLLAVLAQYEARRGVDRERAVALASRALEAGSLIGAGSVALHYACTTLRVAWHPDATEIHDSAVAAARRRGDLLDVALLLGNRGWLTKERGDLLAAEPDAREGLSVAEQHGAPLIVAYNLVFLADLLLERGEIDAAAAALAGADVPEEEPESGHLILHFQTRGRLRLAERRPDAALADLLAVGRLADGLGIRNPAYRPWRSYAVAALHALGRDDEARELAATELELARRWGAPPPIGAALRALALVGQPGEREAWLREAIDVLAGSSAQLEHAKALADLGAAMRRQNARAEARELLRESLELAHRCGAAPLAQRASEELAATGARPRKLVQIGLDSLTASERRVAELAAGDLSNKDIAQALFVTVKPVEVHPPTGSASSTSIRGGSSRPRSGANTSNWPPSRKLS